MKRYPTVPRYVLPSGPSRAVRDRPARRTRPHCAALLSHDTAASVSGLRQAGGPTRCGVAPVGACAVRMEADDPGCGGSSLLVLAVSTDLASQHHGGGAVERGSCRVRRSWWRSRRSWSMRMSIARICAALGVAWNTASDAILAAGAELLVDSADRFDGVTTVGVDEHVWRHTRNGDKYVTVIIDLTPKRTRTGPSRLLAVVEGRSKQAIGVLARSPDHGVPGPGRDRRDGRVHRLQDRRGRNDRHRHHRDGSLSRGGPDMGTSSTATGNASSRKRWGIGGVPVTRSTASDASPGPGSVLLTAKQQHRPAKVFADERHVAFKVTWNLYQSVIEAYQTDQPTEGKKIITSIHSDVPASLEELRSLGQTMKRHRDDILAFFDHPGTSNGPTEAVNGLLEHLHGTSKSFCSIVNYVARRLLDAGGFKPLIHSLL